MGIALALRRIPGAPPLGLLALAAQGPDWGDALRAVVVGPLPADSLWWSPHAFPLLPIGAAGAAVVAWAWTRRVRAAGLVAAAWLSHWAADWFTGLKPTYPGGPWLGLRAYERPWLDLALEAAVVLAGWLLWRTTLPVARAGLARAAPPLALAALLLLQLAVDAVLARAAP